MDVRKKTALLVTGMNILLTILKFVLYFFSGSLVILAEAWHSFSDIATSFMVYIAVGKRIKAEEGSEGLKKQSGWFFELKVSLGIGLLLLFVSIMLIRHVLVGGSVTVQKPVISGLIFLVFAIGSYLVSRFERSIGEQSDSIGLIADSIHAKADMSASLMAGFSLLLYSINIDIDRWVALLISLFILSFSIEVIVNVFLSRYSKKEHTVVQFKSYHVIAYLLDPREMIKFFRSLDQSLGLNLFDKKWMHWVGLSLRTIVPVLLVCWYLSTSLYSVGPSQQAVLLTFGDASAEHIVEPGGHIKLPWPFQTVIIKDVHRIESLSIGNITDEKTNALLWTRVHGTEEAFLSGDNYFMFPYVTVHYRIDNLYDFLFHLQDPIDFMTGESNRIITQIFARQAFYDLATTYRVEIGITLKKELQACLNDIGAGVEIVEVNIRDMHPPILIADSFEQVIAAIQQKEQIINEAYAYQNQRLPEARGKAIKEIESSKAFVVDKVNRSEGDATRFAMRRETFTQNQAVLKKKLYLQTMRKSMLDSRKVIYDPKAGSPTLWLGSKGDTAVPWQMGGPEE